MSSAVGGRGTRMSTPLIDSITVLIILITTFLAYNSNRGLPWVPSQILHIEVKDAANIVPGNEVRIGGTRVGIVSKAQAKRYPNGLVTAVLTLKLDQGTQKIPTNSTILIRSRSLLGLKYVQITPGNATKDFAWGGNVPLKNATPDPVEIDQLLNTFDKPTRTGLEQTVNAYGDALVGRGSVLGKIIDDAGPLATDLGPVTKILADQQNGLVPFLTALGRFTGELAAAGNSTGGLFRDLDNTAAAIERANPELDQTLQKAPGDLGSTAASLRATRTLIAPHIELAKNLRPAFRAIADGAGDLAAASRAGVTGLAGTPKFSRDFVGVLDRLDEVGNSSVVARGLDGLTQFSTSSQPLVGALSRTETTCGYLSLLFRNLASVTADGDSVGNWVGVVPFLPAYVPNGEGLPATAPANGATGLPDSQYAGTGFTALRSGLTHSGYLHSDPKPVVGVNGVCGPGYETIPSTTAAPATDTTMAPGIQVNAPATKKTVYRTKPPIGSEFRVDATTPAKKGSK